MFYTRALTSVYPHRSLKNRLVYSFTLLFIAGFSFLFSNIAHANTTIALTQIVAHPSLDKIHQGILDELSTEGYSPSKTTRFLVENAQGNIALATQIAQGFAAAHPQVIIAIATPSAQTVIQATQNTTIPIVFASITDPISAKLVTDLSHPGGRVTGTRNRSPVEKQITLLTQLLPQAKSFGIIFNAAETNSVDLLNTIKTVANIHHLEIKTATVSNSSEVSTAVESLATHVDGFILLQDNTVASAEPAFIKAADKYHRPLFATYLSAVKAGALAGFACDEYSLGRQTGKMAARILRGEHAGDIAVEDPAHFELDINLETAKKLHLTLQHTLVQHATHVYGAAS